MMTMHVCLKTYYVRDRTGELRPITTKTFIVNMIGKSTLEDLPKLKNRATEPLAQVNISILIIGSINLGV
jgi:hypothetical protein